MNNTFSLEQISRTGNLNANLVLRQRKLNLMGRFMEIEIVNPKRKQNEIAIDIGYSCSTLQRYRNDIKRHSPYKLNNPKEPQKTPNARSAISSQTKHDLKRPQMTSKEPITKKEANSKVKIQVIILIMEVFYLNKLSQTNEMKILAEKNQKMAELNQFYSKRFNSTKRNIANQSKILKRITCDTIKNRAESFNPK